MDYRAKIAAYMPRDEREAADQRVILKYIDRYPDNVLLRDNEIAHITSSALILNPTLDRVLFVHHNIRGVWGWTGGHADGETDLLAVAMREACEETGVSRVEAISTEIAGIDILTVQRHYRKGYYVNSHLHLSVAYLLVCSEGERLTAKPDENSGVAWFATDQINERNFSAGDVYVYRKLLQAAGSRILRSKIQLE